MKPVLAILLTSFVSLAAAHAELKVASLSTITTDIAKNVGGNKIDLFSLVKAGVDPHEFQPTPSDVKKIADASLVLFTGKHIEGYLNSIAVAAWDCSGRMRQASPRF